MLLPEAGAPNLGRDGSVGTAGVLRVWRGLLHLDVLTQISENEFLPIAEMLTQRIQRNSKRELGPGRRQTLIRNLRIVLNVVLQNCYGRHLGFPKLNYLRFQKYIG